MQNNQVYDPVQDKNDILGKRMEEARVKVESISDQQWTKICYEHEIFRLTMKSKAWQRKNWLSNFLRLKTNREQKALEELRQNKSLSVKPFGDEPRTDPLLAQYWRVLHGAKIAKITACDKRILSAANVITQEEALGFNKIPGFSAMTPDDKLRYENFYLLAKYPDFAQRPVAVQQAPPAISSKVSADNLSDRIRTVIAELYDCKEENMTSEKLLQHVRGKVSAWDWGWLEPSEYTTVKLLLEEAEKSKSLDMLEVELALDRLKRKYNRRTSRSKKKVEQDTISSAMKKMREEMRTVYIKEQTVVLSSFTAEEEDEHGRVMVRQQQLDSYNAVIQNPQKSIAVIDSNLLPSSRDDLQALAYFVFKRNIQEVVAENVTPFFPISWNKDNGLVLTLDQSHSWAAMLTVFNNEELLRALSPANYFAALITSMALIFAKNNTSLFLCKMLLESIFSNTKSYPLNKNIAKGVVAKDDLAWLTPYLPDSLQATPQSEVVQNAMTTLKNQEMFVAEPVVEKSTVTLKENDKGDIKYLTEVVCKLYQPSLFVMDEVRRKSKGKSYCDDKYISDNDWARWERYVAQEVDHSVVSLTMLLDTFLLQRTEKNKFYKEMAAINVQIKKRLPEPDRLTVSNRSFVLAWAERSNLSSSEKEFYQALTCVFPSQSVIYPGGKFSKHDDNPDFIQFHKNSPGQAQKVMRELTHKIQPTQAPKMNYAQYFDANPRANPWVVAAYCLGVWFKETNRGRAIFGKKTKTAEDNTFIQQYTAMLAALELAVSGKQKNFDEFFMKLVPNPSENYPFSLFNKSKVPSSLDKLLATINLLIESAEYYKNHYYTLDERILDSVAIPLTPESENRNDSITESRETTTTADETLSTADETLSTADETLSNDSWHADNAERSISNNSTLSSKHSNSFYHQPPSFSDQVLNAVKRMKQEAINSLSTTGGCDDKEKLNNFTLNEWAWNTCFNDISLNHRQLFCEKNINMLAVWFLLECVKESFFCECSANDDQDKKGKAFSLKTELIKVQGELIKKMKGLQSDLPQSLQLEGDRSSGESTALRALECVMETAINDYSKPEKITCP